MFYLKQIEINEIKNRCQRCNSEWMLLFFILQIDRHSVAEKQLGLKSQ